MYLAILKKVYDVIAKFSIKNKEIGGINWKRQLLQKKDKYFNAYLKDSDAVTLVGWQGGP